KFRQQVHLNVAHLAEAKEDNCCRGSQDEQSKLQAGSNNPTHHLNLQSPVAHNVLSCRDDNNDLRLQRRDRPGTPPSGQVDVDSFEEGRLGMSSMGSAPAPAPLRAPRPQTVAERKDTPTMKQSQIRRPVTYPDDGPKNSGARTQLLERMVQFAD